MTETPAHGRALSAVALILAGGGVVYFLSATHVASSSAGSTAIGVVCLSVLIYLVRTVDPAWLFSGGIVASIFGGHWGLLGIYTNPAPHRIVLLAAMAGVLFRIGPSRDRPPISFTGAHFAMLAAAAYVTVSALASGTLGNTYAQSNLLDVFGIVPFAMFVFAPVVFASQRQRMILLGALVGTGAYLSLTALFEKLKLNVLVWPDYVTNPAVGAHFGRARGPFIDAGADGLALYMCTIAAVVAFFTWRRPLQRAIAAGVAVLAPIGILETVTRGVWLAAIIGTLVTLATTDRLRRYLPPVAAAGLVIVLIAFAFVPGLARQSHERQADKGPIYERQNTTAAGLRMIADRPFFGFGWQNAYHHLNPYFRLDRNIPLVGGIAGLHDIYLQYAVELGAVGLALWMLAALLGLGGALASRAPPGVRPWQIGLKACILAWVVVGLVSPASFEFTTALLWTWAGLVHRRRDEVPVALREPVPDGLRLTPALG